MLMQIGRLSMNTLYSWIHSFIHTYIYSFGIMNSNHPSAIVCDFYLTGAQVASLSNSVPLVLYSVDPLSDFYPATFSFSDMRRHLLVEMAVEHHTTFVYSIWLCHQQIANFIHSMNLPNQPVFPLYSVPVIVFNGIDYLFPSETMYVLFILLKSQFKHTI